jgi:SET domain-containing protein
MCYCSQIYQNHSCNANLGILETYLWEKNTLSGIAMRALRDIEAGEELTVPYYHPTQLVCLYSLTIINLN